MTDLDLVIRNGTVVTAADRTRSDVGIRGGRIVALAEAGFLEGDRTIDAGGKLVLPGGVDGHCHIDQKSSMGILTADDFYTGGVSAACGGTTTFIPFAAQHRGESLTEVVAAYHRRAERAFIDYAFHLISQSRLHDRMDYTPFEGMKVRGWPVMTLSRGEVLWEGGDVRGEPGRGRFLERSTVTASPLSPA